MSAFRGIVNGNATPGAGTCHGQYQVFRSIQGKGRKKTLNRADIGPALKEAIEITGKGAPYLVEIIAKEGYDISRYQEHTS